jgi:hypothetical protein
MPHAVPGIRQRDPGLPRTRAGSVDLLVTKCLLVTKFHLVMPVGWKLCFRGAELGGALLSKPEVPLAMHRSPIPSHRSSARAPAKEGGNLVRNRAHRTTRGRKQLPDLKAPRGASEAHH